MTATSIPSPSVALDDPERATSPSPNPHRRGLGSLRRLGSSSPNDASRSLPRSIFFRSVSYPAPTTDTARSDTALDNARPNDAQTQAVDKPGEQDTAAREIAGHGSVASPAEDEADARSSDMARPRQTGHPRGAVSDGIRNAEAQRSTMVVGDAGADIIIASNAPTDGSHQESPDDRPRLPTIRFFSHQELRQGRPSLTFSPIIRTLPSESSIIRVGRYSEREGIPISNPAGPSDAPVGFKSKVVSRKHCEFSFLNGSWQIKDVSSSSGTFLNHIRLSQPNTESRLYPVKDGDIVQLGIDFRGGEEMIFRCVKIRIECNRSWQKRPNNFNMNRHAQLQKLGKEDAKVDENKGECSICLGDVAPCQSLFIAACAHVWHYRCIRRMLMGSTYPQFTCPNCRAITDLEAEIDADDGDEWEQPVDEPARHVSNPVVFTVQPSVSRPNRDDTAHAGGAAAAYEGPEREGLGDDDDLTNLYFEADADQATAAQQFGNSLLSRRQTSNTRSSSSQSAAINGMDIPMTLNGLQRAQVFNNHAAGALHNPTPNAADIIGGEGPLTPRNDAGPWVFDGSAGRASDRLVTAMDESE